MNLFIYYSFIDILDNGMAHEGSFAMYYRGVAPAFRIVN